jgi:hypothetical protein
VAIGGTGCGIVLLAAALGACTAESSQLEAVGFQTRSIDVESRHIVALVWSPADSRVVTRQVRFADYVAADSSAPRPAGTPRDRLRESLSEVGPTSDADIDSVLAVPRPVHHGPGAATRPLPVFVLTTGMNAPAYLNVSVAERLAAAGYLVVAVPTGGYAGRARLPFDSTGIRAHVDDLRSVLLAVRTWPDADSTRIALGAWSVGGIASALMANEIPGVRALVSIDDATSSEYGTTYLDLLTSKDWVSRVPYLDLRAGAPSRVTRSLRFLERRCDSPAVRAEYPSLAHRHFTSIWGILAPDLAPEQRAVIQLATTAWETLVLQFLSVSLSGGDFETLAGSTGSWRVWTEQTARC